MNSYKFTPLKPTTQNLSYAIFTVNRHAKTATNPKFLYLLKKKAIEKMIHEGKALKVGLHFSEHPKYSQQQSDVLVRCGDYTFHIPPSKTDFKQLPHLGKLDHSSRNPKCRMSLSQAKQLLQDYTGLKEDHNPRQNRGLNKKNNKPVFKKLGDSFF
ncbi:YkyB family protein [Heyndrickxia acidiproducens]|uniref:YkyB family protein n=1 Tax=Heyndrickxia acidiproducens TaxID=1121084 RepID=UPI00037A9CF3